jgi:hypothetical protein
MLFAIPYPECHFGFRYSYPLDFVKSDTDALKRIPAGFDAEITTSIYTPNCNHVACVSKPPTDNPDNNNEI